MALVQNICSLSFLQAPLINEVFPHLGRELCIKQSLRRVVGWALRVHLGACEIPEPSFLFCEDVPPLLRKREG